MSKCQTTYLSDVSQRSPRGVVTVGHSVSVGDSVEHDRNNAEDLCLIWQSGVLEREGSDQIVHGSLGETVANVSGGRAEGRGSTSQDQQTTLVCGVNWARLGNFKNLKRIKCQILENCPDILGIISFLN